MFGKYCPGFSEANDRPVSSGSYYSVLYSRMRDINQLTLLQENAGEAAAAEQAAGLASS